MARVGWNDRTDPIEKLPVTFVIVDSAPHLTETGVRNLLDARGVRELIVQSGGELNASLVRLGLIDHVSIVIAPILVGGRSTPALIGGDPVETPADLRLIAGLELQNVLVLPASFLLVRYDVRRPTTRPASPRG
jgi:riboflavin biosynthesis pyrimidine reductase